MFGKKGGEVYRTIKLNSTVSSLTWLFKKIYHKYYEFISAPQY